MSVGCAASAGTLIKSACSVNRKASAKTTKTTLNEICYRPTRSDPLKYTYAHTHATSKKIKSIFNEGKAANNKSH